MTYEPRPYQAEAIARAVNYLTSGKGNGVLVEPTGSGKSLVIAGVCTRLPGECVVFQPSREILQQNHDKLVAYGYRPGVYSASAGRKELGGDVTLATIGSVVKKPELFRDVKFGLVDECHLVGQTGMYVDFFKALPGVRWLGLTATPYRLHTDGYGGAMLKFLTRTRPRVFHDVVHVTQNADLFRAGYLARLDYREVAGFEPAKVKANSTGADFDDDSLQLHFRDIAYDNLLTRCVKRCFEVGRRHVLVFTRFVHEAEYVARVVPGCAVVTAKTPDAERDRTLADFKAGKLQAVANVGVLTVGFDFPELDAVVLARPTKSLALYYQMVGRVVRPHPAKADGLVVDLVGLKRRFGPVEELEVRQQGKLWAVFSRTCALTNVYLEQPDPARRRWRR